MADQNNLPNQPDVSNTPSEAPAVPPAPPAPGQAREPQETAPQAAPAATPAPAPSSEPVSTPPASPYSQQPGAASGAYAQQGQAAPANPYTPQGGAAGYAQQATPANPYAPQGQQPYGANPYGQPTAPNYAGNTSQNDGRATAALVLGIVAIVFFFTAIGGILFGIIAIILGALSIKGSSSGRAKAGIVCGIVGLILSILMTVGLVVGVAMLDYDTPGFDETAITEDFGDSVPTPDEGTDPGEPSTESPQTEAAVSDIDFSNIDATIADDQYCSVTVNRAEIDGAGDLCFYFTMTNNSDKALEIWSDLGSWKLNDEAADLYCYTEVEPGETVDDYFFIEAESLPEGGLDAISSLSGTLIVGTADETLSDYTFSLS